LVYLARAVVLHFQPVAQTSAGWTY
jgi:hypothetical protein